MYKTNGFFKCLIAAVFLSSCGRTNTIPLQLEPSLATQTPTSNTSTPAVPVPPTFTAIPSNILLIENFTATSVEFGVNSNEKGSIEIRDGSYIVRATNHEIWQWGQSTSKFENTVIEFDATLFNGPANNNAGFGIICRLSEREDALVDGYMLAISGDGYYTIRKITASSMSPLVDWSHSDAIHQGNVNNKIRATCNGNELKLEANSQLLATTNTIEGGATFGALAFSAISFEEAEPVAEIHFDNLIVSRP